MKRQLPGRAGRRPAAAPLWLSVVLVLGASCTTSDLLLSRVQLALVVGGEEAVSVLDATGFQAGGRYTATSDDPSVATATVAGSQVTITALALGRTSVRVSGEGGARVLPVQVYDPRVLETRELTIAFTDQFTGSGMVLACSYDRYSCAWGWQPVAPEGYWTFGTHFTKADGAYPAVVNPTGSQAVMVVKPRNDTAVAAPTGWTLPCSGSTVGSYIYRATCPDGYVALGDQAGNADAAWRATFACVRADLTSPGRVQLAKVSEGNSWWAIWRILPPDPVPVAGNYFGPGGWLNSIYHCSNPGVVADPSVNVLKLDFGLLDEAAPQAVVPRLDSLIPLQGLENNLDTAPTVSRAMLVPYNSINDAYWPNLTTRLHESPFYRLEQQAFYRLKKSLYNQTSLQQEPYFELTQGISTTESTRFETQTGVTISFEAGVQLKVFEASVTASLSRTFGYSTETSVQELKQETTHIPFSVAPGKATAVWQLYHRFVLYRHHGTALEPVAAAVEIGTNSFVIDEYPHGGGGR